MAVIFWTSWCVPICTTETLFALICSTLEKRGFQPLACKLTTGPKKPGMCDVPSAWVSCRCYGAHLHVHKPSLEAYNAGRFYFLSNVVFGGLHRNINIVEPLNLYNISTAEIWLTSISQRRVMNHGIARWWIAKRHRKSPAQQRQQIQHDNSITGTFAVLEMRLLALFEVTNI